MKFRFSLDWLLIFVPIALLLRFVPAFSNPTALFICSAIAIIPVAGWIGHATEAVVASVHIRFQISGDGETNCIEGVQLLSVYLILAFSLLLSARTARRHPSPALRAA